MLILFTQQAVNFKSDLDTALTAPVVRRVWNYLICPVKHFDLNKLFVLLLVSMQTMRLVLESMMLRMEEYANSLENLVTERTEDYFAEKKKTEDLLYELLPK